MKIRTRENTGIDYEDKAMRRDKEWIMHWNKLRGRSRLATHTGPHQCSSKCDTRPDVSETAGVFIKNWSCRVTLQKYLTKSLGFGCSFLSSSHMILIRLKFAKHWPISLCLCFLVIKLRGVCAVSSQEEKTCQSHRHTRNPFF